MGNCENNFRAENDYQIYCLKCFCSVYNKCCECLRMHTTHAFTRSYVHPPAYSIRPNKVLMNIAKWCAIKSGNYY